MAKHSKENAASDFKDGRHPFEETDEFVNDLPDGNLLSQILGFADGDLSHTGSMQEIESRLLPVVRRYPRDQPFNENLLAEMVQAILPEIKELSTPLSEKLFAWVAKTLYSDPIARNRLERIWTQFIGRVDNGT